MVCVSINCEAQRGKQVPYPKRKGLGLIQTCEREVLAVTKKGKLTNATKRLTTAGDATEHQKDIPHKSVYIQFEYPFD